MLKKRLKKDIIIKAGTIFEDCSNRIIEMHDKEHIRYDFGFTKDGIGTVLCSYEKDDTELEEWFEDAKSSAQ